MTRPVVLNTRPRDQAAELSGLLRDAGCDVVEVAATEIVGNWDAGDLRQIGTHSYDWIVLPSQNAARYLSEALGGELPRANILCGEASARALHIDAAETLVRFSARAALDALRPLLRPGERVLVPRAAEGRDELIEGLTALGVQVDAPVLYRTVPAAPEVFAGLARLDVITLCSPSAVLAVVHGVGRERLLDTRVVCLGDTTADAARAAGLRVDSIARHTSMTSLVEAVLDVVPRVVA